MANIKLNIFDKIKNNIIFKQSQKFANIILVSSIVCFVVTVTSYFINNTSYFVWLIFVYFPLCWMLWLLAYVFCDLELINRKKMKAAWVVNSFAIMSLLLSLSLIPKIITDRSFVEVGDITAIAFFPVAFPIGLLPDYFLLLADKIIYKGDGSLYRLMRSQGLPVYTFIMWLTYCIAGLFQTWIIISGMRHLVTYKKKKN